MPRPTPRLAVAHSPTPSTVRIGRLVEGRAEERAGRVRQVMLAEQDAVRRHAEARLQQVLDPQLVAEPGDHRLAEDFVRPGEHLHARQEQALELHERLLEEDDVVEVVGRDAGRLQAEVDRALRELEVVLLAAEALLFGRGDEHAVAQDRGGGVVEVAGDAQDVHQDCRRARTSGSSAGACGRGRHPRPVRRRPSGSAARIPSPKGARTTK